MSWLLSMLSSKTVSHSPTPPPAFFGLSCCWHFEAFKSVVCRMSLNLDFWIGSSWLDSGWQVWYSWWLSDGIYLFMLQKWRLRVREGCHTLTERLTRGWCRELVSQPVLVLHTVGSSWEVLSLGFLQCMCLVVTFSPLTMNGEQILIGFQNSVGRRGTPQRDKGRGAFNILRWSLAFIVSLAGTPNSPLSSFRNFTFSAPL